jgi:hypothetical protein
MNLIIINRIKRTILKKILKQNTTKMIKSTKKETKINNKNKLSK